MTGHLPDTLLHFARTLRSAGMRVGPGEVIEAARAMLAIGLDRRDDLQAALAAVLVKRRQDRALFDQAFHLFWKDPQLFARMLSLLLPRLTLPAGRGEGDDILRRLADALAPQSGEGQPADSDSLAVEAMLEWSADERLRRLDFEAMTADELRQAQEAMRQIRVVLPPRPTRRKSPDPNGTQLDLRASLRAGLRSGGDMIALRRWRRKERPPPLVVLCDISGSMERYARALLSFMHALANDGHSFHGFVFATRLTNITRFLRHRDVDLAMAEAGHSVADWSGGTRIGACLEVFNRQWSRRILGQGATVLLMTDGLDQAAGPDLARQMDRLHKSCRRLVWLNPLLRWESFAPKATGIRTMLPHVDDFLPVHSLASLDRLAAALSDPPTTGRAPQRQWSCQP